MTLIYNIYLPIHGRFFLKIIKHMPCPNLSHIYIDMAQIRADHMFDNFKKNKNYRALVNICIIY